MPLLWPHLKVYENLTFPREIISFTSDLPHVIADALQRVGFVSRPLLRSRWHAAERQGRLVSSSNSNKIIAFCGVVQG